MIAISLEISFFSGMIITDESFCDCCQSKLDLLHSEIGANVLCRVVCASAGGMCDNASS